MTAAKLLQEYLDFVSAAVMAGDFEAYQRKIMLPFALITHAENISVSTPEQLRINFHAFRQTLQMHKVTDFIRLVESAKIVDEDLLTGCYISHLIAGGHRIMQPYTSQITLRQRDGVWCAASITNSVANLRWPFLLPSVTNTPLNEGPTQ
jgi:hypothetical protein